MSIVAADTVVSSRGQGVTVVGAELSNGAGIDLATLQTYAIDPLLHAYSKERGTLEYDALVVPAVIQKIGDIVTFSWDGFTYTTAGGNLPAHSQLLGIMYPANQASSVIYYTLNGTVGVGRVNIADIAVWFYGDDGTGSFGAGDLYIFPGSVSWHLF